MQAKTRFQDLSLGSCWRSCGPNWGQLGFPGKPVRQPPPLSRAGPLRAWPCAPGPLPARSCTSDQRSFSEGAGVFSSKVPIVAYFTRNLVAAWEQGKTRKLAARCWHGPGSERFTGKHHPSPRKIAVPCQRPRKTPSVVQPWRPRPSSPHRRLVSFPTSQTAPTIASHSPFSAQFQHADKLPTSRSLPCPFSKWQPLTSTREEAGAGDDCP